MAETLSLWFADLPVIARIALGLAAWFATVVLGVLAFALLPWIWSFPDRWARVRVRLGGDPPWKRPRHVADMGGRRAWAEFALLWARLDEAGTPVSPRPPGPHQIGEAERMVDRHTGQVWIATFHEFGFNQWTELDPQ